MTGPLMRVLVVTGATIYVGTLHLLYATVVAPQFSYSGLVFKPAADGSVELALAMAALPAVWLPVQASRPSQIVIWMLYALAYVPSILIPTYVLDTGLLGLFPLTFAIFTSFVVLSLMQRLRIRDADYPTMSRRTYENFVLTVAILFGSYIVLAFGIPSSLPGVANVYDVRSAFNQDVVTSNALPFIAYVVFWSGNVVNPLLMLLGARSGRLTLFLAGLAIEMLVFGTTGQKTVLFSVALILLLLLLLSGPARRAFGLSVPVAAAAMLVAADIWSQLTDSTLAIALFIVRLIAVPGLLVADYFEFFSEHLRYGLSHSILAFLGPMPYDVGPAYLIGGVYFGDPATSANANIWADGFMNFGIAGILASTFILGAYLVVLDAAASGRDLRVTGPLAGMMAITLSNTGILTAFMTHGLGLALILILLMPRQVEPRVSADIQPAAAPALSRN